MELRHLRYFVAVAEERSFVQAARRLRVAQPALSRQIRDLEAEVGVRLLQRLPRGVRLTVAGEIFAADARSTLEIAARAVATARRAGQQNASVLHFGTGPEMGVYAAAVADLLAAFRRVNPGTDIQVSNQDETHQLPSLRERSIDVAATFLTEWPVARFEAHRLASAPLEGVLLPASHPLASKATVHLSELESLTFLHSAGVYWPQNFRIIKAAMAERGWISSPTRERPALSGSVFLEIAAGAGWSLANPAMAAPVLASTTSVVYRPMADPPIPGWVALIWLPPGSQAVHQLVDIARDLGLYVVEEDRPALKARSIGGHRSAS
jgi:LysR family hca operon transcriptional activator